MAEVALTVIGLGREVNGRYERVDVAPGDALPAWVSNEEKKVLRENKALGNPPKVEASVVDAKDAEIDAKDAEIAELKAKLEAMESAKAK